MTTAFEIIYHLRGGWGTECDFCGATPPQEQIHPEEAGMWVCEACIERWEKEALLKEKV